MLRSICLLFLIYPLINLSNASITVKDVPATKKSTYLESGIYQAGSFKNKAQLKSIRHSHRVNEKYERLVFDFGKSKLPEVYVFISSSSGKINIDLANTTISKRIKSNVKSNMIKEVNFFPLANNVLSTEVFVAKSTLVEVFQLKNPTRLVVDLKK